MRSPCAAARPAVLAAVVLAVGGALQVLLWSRQWIYGDQYALFLAGLDVLETGRLPPVAKYMSGGGHVPGGLLPLLVAAPLGVWLDYRAPALLIGAGHLAAAGVLSACIGRALGGAFLAAYLGVYWLSPWRLYHAGFVWEPAYLFLPAALHLACAWRLREAPHAGWSLLLGATLALTAQLHASFVVLAALTALLAARRRLRVHWRGAFAGAAVGALTLAPTAAAWLAGTLPRIAPGATDDLPRVVTAAANGGKAFAYWLRLGAPDIGRRLRESAPAATDVDAGVWAGLASGTTALLVAASAASVLVAAAASWRWFRPRPASTSADANAAAAAWGWFRPWPAPAAGDAPADEAPAPPTPEGWFRAYAGCCFVALCASAAASPAPVQGWHVVIALHAACLPVAAWLLAAFQGRSAARRTVAAAFLLVQVAVVLTFAFGHRMYQPLGGAELAAQDLPPRVRALIPAGR